MESFQKIVRKKLIDVRNESQIYKINRLYKNKNLNRLLDLRCTRENNDIINKRREKLIEEKFKEKNNCTVIKSIRKIFEDNKYSIQSVNLVGEPCK